MFWTSVCCAQQGDKELVLHLGKNMQFISYNSERAVCLNYCVTPTQRDVPGIDSQVNLKQPALGLKVPQVYPWCAMCVSLSETTISEWHFAAVWVFGTLPLFDLTPHKVWSCLNYMEMWNGSCIHFPVQSWESDILGIYFWVWIALDFAIWTCHSRFLYLKLENWRMIALESYMLKF